MKLTYDIIIIRYTKVCVIIIRQIVNFSYKNSSVGTLNRSPDDGHWSKLVENYRNILQEILDCLSFVHSIYIHIYIYHIEGSAFLLYIYIFIYVPPEAQLIHTLSKFHCLIHKLYLTNHHSSQEHATYGTSCLYLAFLSPTTCHRSNLR